MADEPICRDYQWFADILSQSDNVTKATEPTTETVSPVTAYEDDGKKYADELFTPGKRRTPASMLAYADMYDTNQAVSRIMRVFRLCREDYFKQAITNNVNRRAHLQHKAKYTSDLLQSDQAIKDEIEKATQQQGMMVMDSIG